MKDGFEFHTNIDYFIDDMLEMCYIKTDEAVLAKLIYDNDLIFIHKSRRNIPQ